jgi:hypothetical protein
MNVFTDRICKQLGFATQQSHNRLAAAKPPNCEKEEQTANGLPRYPHQ